MSFFEDDRIRAKNRVHNQAYQFVTNCRAEGLSDEAIVELANNNLAQTNTRNEIHSAILKIVGRSSDVAQD